MSVREAGRVERSRRVHEAAAVLFARQGYATTTIPQIAAAARVSVGTVTNTGSKDALFLTAVEEWSTDALVRRIHAAGQAGDSVTARVAAVMDGTLAETERYLDMSRDYLVAFLRTPDHPGNPERLDAVRRAFRRLWPDDGLPDEESPAALAATTTYLCLTSLLFARASRAIAADEARAVLRAIVTAQCAPFEETAAPRSEGDVGQRPHGDRGDGR